MDWNENDDDSETLVIVDTTTDSVRHSMAFDDWKNLDHNFRDELNFKEGVFSGTDITDELTDEQAAILRQSEMSVFATLRAEVKIQDNEFEIKFSFSLGKDSNGIDPLNEDVTLTQADSSRFDPNPK